jgi:putative ABC transport system permease protein
LNEELMMILTLPLAWLQVTREKTRLVVALAGIAFAVILMFMQLGFMNALYEGAKAPHRSLQADLVILNPHSQVLFSVQSFPRERLYQAKRVEGVASINSLYVSLGNWINPETRRSRSILVFGFDPAQSAFKLPEVKQNIDRLKMTDVVLFDRLSRKEFGDIPNLLQQHRLVTTELNGSRIRVGGLFSLGASFAADGNIITSDSTFLHMFKGRNQNKIDVGLITLNPTVAPQQVKSALLQVLPKDVKVLTIDEFAELEKQYWETSAAIGFIFGLGTIMGFIVGAVIVYQILYTDVSDHLAEYATLKAMGYQHFYFLNLVFQQSLILAVLGYIPGIILSVMMYDMTRKDTNLPVFMTVDLALLVLMLTILMCFIAGTISMRKLNSADPADIF